jgi:hypothetical protein
MLTRSVITLSIFFTAIFLLSSGDPALSNTLQRVHIKEQPIETLSLPQVVHGVDFGCAPPKRKD